MSDIYEEGEEGSSGIDIGPISEECEAACLVGAQANPSAAEVAHAGAGPQALPTTVMIRNIPNRYTQHMLARELEALGLEGRFDFLYVPVDKTTLYNVGYAFVNFRDGQWAQRCMERLENYQFKNYRKACGRFATVSVARIQGLEANLRHYESSAAASAERPRSRAPFIATCAAALGAP